MTNKTFLVVGSAIALFLLNQTCARNESRSWNQEDGYRWARLSVPWSGDPGFKQLPGSETGVDFINKVTREEVSKNRIILNGSGVAVGDIDGDDLADLYFCRLDGPNVLYRNLGNWRFEDVTDSAGVACRGQYSTGAAFADIDGDTDLDLLVTSVEGPNACFLNDGKGNFKNITDASGISSATGASTMAFSDIDGDGDLDLYIANYKLKSAKDIWDEGKLSFNFVVQKTKNSYRIAPEFQDHFVLDIRDNFVLYLETGEPDMLFLNDGTGHFERVSMTDGRFLNEDGAPEGELKDWGLMARFQDMDNDGDPDLYVCNDFESPDRIWLNDGTGHFQATPRLAIRNSSNSAMAVDFSDIDRDGDQDFMVMDMLSLSHRLRMTQRNTEVPEAHAIGQIDNRPQYMKNTVFLNRGDNTYAEIGQFSGLRASDWSWSNLFVDVDLDGYEDVLITTGHYYDAQDFDSMRKAQARIKLSTDAIKHFHTRSSTPEIDRLSTVFIYPRLELPNVAFRNHGDLTFQEVSKKWGFDSQDISHGMALGDLDNDGDLDVVMNRLEAPAGVYRNESAAARIAVRLRGLPPNSRGIGAKIKAIGGPAMQTKEVIAAGSYLSSSEPLAVFASDGGDTMTIEVKWRNGKVSSIHNVKANRIYEIYESAAENDVNSPRDGVVTKPFFEDVTHLIKHKHHETPFDDFKRQPLLTKRLSQLGPGVAWYDLDSDGDDDLFIGSGKGGNLSYFENIGEKGFRRGNLGSNTFEQTTVLGWSREKGKASLLVGNSNYENQQQSDSFVAGYDFQRTQHSTEMKIPAGESALGPIAMADYDNDGDLDLFVGGRTIPGRYPEPATSLLYQNQDGQFKLDAANEARFKDLGMVSGAVFSDLDGDAQPELILAVEWGPIMVFRNQNGIFTDATRALGLADSPGWWQGVTTGDLDEDGDMDIIATNWGLNSKYETRYDREHPLHLFYDDFDNNGILDLVEAYHYGKTPTLLPERNLFSMILAMPHIMMRIPDNKKYGRSTLAEIMGRQLKRAKELKANTLAQTVFFNHGNRFEAVEMPRKAQFAPAFYAGVADYDGDGHEDLFLSQNFFAVPVQMPRLDAGRGLWLKGDGSGHLQPISGHESGVNVYGEQRGAALADYDRDGRVDLVVSQNGATTKLFHNIGAKPGLRVRLEGPKGNPDAVGATMRLIYEDGYGPAREVHSGSGYWSQDSMIQVLGIRSTLKGIWVRWPEGKITETTIRKTARSIIVKVGGEAIVE